MSLPLLKNASVEGRKVLLRLDFDVPLSTAGRITDDTRLLVGMDTLKYLLHRKATVIAVGHLGRPPKGVRSKDDLSKFSLKPVAHWFAQKLKNEPKEVKMGPFPGWKITERFFVLENIRLYKEEEENDPVFAKKLASLGDIYVNDAFDTSHRDHASIAGVPKYLPHYAGLRLELEIHELSQLLDHPKRPLCIIIGGSKIETKLPLIEKMHQFADYVLVGGKIAEETEELLRVQHEHITGRKSALMVGELNQNKTDVTPNTVENFRQIINMSNAIVWNGPLGIIENSEFKTQQARARESDSGTQKIAEAIIKRNMYALVGGGDTVGFLRENNLLDSFHISTGGGAMLSYLAGEKLPGIEALLTK